MNNLTKKFLSIFDKKKSLEKKLEKKQKELKKLSKKILSEKEKEKKIKINKEIMGIKKDIKKRDKEFSKMLLKKKVGEDISSIIDDFIKEEENTIILSKESIDYFKNKIKNMKK